MENLIFCFIAYFTLIIVSVEQETRIKISQGFISASDKVFSAL
ncbi:hypothetical protein [Daejeonella sp.]|nr:hypothetical protein [Daejeonella sp.]HQT57622.1 hypothetical protein [Daejeonella sp.]